MRITPACAGKTHPRALPVFRPSDHPRVCGENRCAQKKRYPRFGSPPRVRGKPLPLPPLSQPVRITPACAGKTKSERENWQERTDHPRVCGENPIQLALYRLNLGSPPRVRGKLRPLLFTRCLPRITPACAGKTTAPGARCGSMTDHPRVCGENWSSGLSLGGAVGSPPRVRGKLREATGRLPKIRITPACAGKTLLRAFALRP